MEKNTEMRNKTKYMVSFCVGLAFIFESSCAVKKIPRWPFAATWYTHDDLVQGELSCLWASKAFSSSGRTEDVSRLVFGQASLRLQDMLLASRLLAEQKVNASSIAALDTTGFIPESANHYLSVLANQLFIFDACVEREQCTLHYARHYRQGDVSFGFSIPIVRKKNHLRLVSSLSADLTEQLHSSDPLGLVPATNTDPNARGLNVSSFFDSYDDLKDFFKDTLERKGIHFSHNHDTEVGLGDITTFFNVEIKSQHCERCIVGVKVVLPSSAQRNVHKLWEAELGDEGFISLGIFGAVLYARSQYFNPYLFGHLSFSPGARVDRRVPENKSYNGLQPAPLNAKVPADFMTFGEQVAFAVPFGPIPDTAVRNMAAKTKRIKITKGPELNIRMGNMWGSIFSRRGTLDIFYDLRAKGKDYVGLQRPDSTFDPSILTDNSYQMAHKIGGRYTYTFMSTWKYHTEFLYTFAGRNVLVGYECATALSADF